MRGAPDEYLKAIANKSGEIPKKSGQLIKLLNDLGEFLGKKTKGKLFNDEIKKVLDDAVKYFQQNKKTFSLVDDVDNALLPYIRILKRNRSYQESIEYIKLIRRPLGKWLALEQEATVNLYTKSYYIAFNKALRKLGGVKLTQEFKATQKVLDNALDKLPVSGYNNEILHRSAYFTEKEISKLFKKGKDFTDNGYFSTTHSEAALHKWMTSNPTDNVLFKVQGKNGKLIEASSNISDEAEVLFKSGTEFVVDGMKSIPNPVDRTKKVLEITLKEK